MALFNRQKNSTVPLELQPYYDAPKTGPRGWLMWLVRIVALLIVIVALVFAGRWGWQKIDKNDKKVGTTVSQQGKLTDTSSTKTNKTATNKAASSATPKSQSQASVTPSDDSSSTNSTTTPSTSTDTSAATPSNLVNTGPGSSLVIFSAAAVIGTAVFQLYLRFKRRLAA